MLKANESQLDPFLLKHPLPKGFWLASSYVPVSYYIGLYESDSLCTQVFLEIVGRHLWKFIRVNQYSMWEFFSGYPGEVRRDQGINLPIVGERTVGGDHKDSRLVLKDVEELGYGFVRYVPDPVGAWAYPYASYRHVLWQPGERWFSLESRLMMPDGVLLIVFGLLALGLYRVVSREGFAIRSAAILFLLVVIPGFVTYSDFTYFFRGKELRFLWPLIGMAYAVAVWTVWELGADLYRRARARLA